MANKEMPAYWADVPAEAAESGGRGVVIYSYPNGWKKIVTSTTPGARNHNPSNLNYEHEKNAQHHGALRIDKDGYAIFPDWLTGKRAADEWWEDARNEGKTIDSAVNKFLRHDKPANIEQRKKDLVKKANTLGYRDRYGNPVNRHTNLSDLTYEQFTTLRDYNNIQLEGFFNTAPKAEQIEWIPPGAPVPQRPAGRPGAPAPQPQAPVGKPSVPPSPAKPQSFLEAPQPSNPLAYPGRGAVGPAEPAAGPNRFLSPGPSPAFQASFAAPFARHSGGDAFLPLGSPSLPGLGGRSNPLATPPLLDSLALGSTNLANDRASGQAQGERPLNAGQAKKAPFYSLKDRLDFLGRVYRVAKPVSEATGLSLPFILAHAAHEVDFGKKIQGNNLCNLRADRGWQGPTYARASETYRTYPSLEESMKDYLAFLRANPRFAKMFEPVTRASMGRLADAIHYAGFSDDPLYGPRILAAAKNPIMKQALWQYEHWPPKESL